MKKRKALSPENESNKCSIEKDNGVFIV
jgi:hypothetical protein